MVFSMFGGGSKSGPALRPMEESDLGSVLRLISQYDADDFTQAREDLKESLEGMFVLSEGRKVVGVTGGVVDPHSDDIVWLSWTYVDIERQGQGLGTTMFNALTGMLQQDGVRKLFVNASDHMRDGQDMYAPARAFYEKMGATLEVELPDYHARGETRFTYGLDLTRGVDRSLHPSGGAVRFIDIEELDESDAGWGLVWEEAEGAADPANVDSGLQHWINEARGRHGRILFAAVPSDLCANLNEAFATAAFAYHGRLLDYFAPNIHQELGSLHLK